MFTPVNEEGVTEEPDYAGFISGGVEAIPNQFPWVVRMLVARSSDNDFQFMSHDKINNNKS